MLPSRPALLSSFGVVVLATLLASCGGTALESDGSGSGGTSSGGASSGGASSGGASSGGHGSSVGGVTSTGGAPSGGGGVGAIGGSAGSSNPGACVVDADCVAVLDASAPCFSAFCSSPTVASRDDVARDRCLVLWDEREGELPTGCQSGVEIACPAVCAVQPECAVPRCDEGSCALDVGYAPSECEGLGETCGVLGAARRSAIEAARACSADLDVVQCSGSELIDDECGCPVVLNEARPELVSEARRANQRWLTNDCPRPVCPAIACAPVQSGQCTAGARSDVCTPN